MSLRRHYPAETVTNSGAAHDKDRYAPYGSLSVTYNRDKAVQVRITIENACKVQRVSILGA